MSPRPPQTVLVLGGIRSGKSEFAESLVGEAGAVRYVATSVIETDTVIKTDTGPATSGAGLDASTSTGAAVIDGGAEIDDGTTIDGGAEIDDGTAIDAEWAARIDAHRDRRPAHWTTEEIGKAPEELASLIESAGADETLLVDDIGGWLTAVLAISPAGGKPDGAHRAAIAALAAAVANSPGRVVIVSPEVGLSVIPATPLGRAFADACGETNRALADACDGVVLVVAGQPTWLKATAGRLPESIVLTPPTAAPVRPAVPVADFDSAVDLGAVDLGLVDGAIAVGMTLPLPDHDATTAATEHVAELPVPGAGLGAMAAAVTFIAGARGTGTPEPFRSVRVIHVYGAYDGGIAAGDTAANWDARLASIRSGESPLARLAATAGASIELINTGAALPFEDGNAATGDDISEALRRGWLAANAAADRGDDLIVLAAGGPGVDAAAAATVASLTTAEVPSLLGRVWRDGGRIDDDAWMTRCIVARDALRQLRSATGPAADGPKALAALGGPALATATGVLLGAAQRRTPVFLDGPVGAAAALVAREYATQSRLWCLLVDGGNHPTVRVAADMLSLTPLVDLRIGLGEGCTTLALLPLIQSALLLSSAVLTASA